MNLKDFITKKEVKIKGKKIGFIASDLAFVSYRKPEHLFKLYQGWGLNKSLLEDLIQKGIG